MGIFRFKVLVNGAFPFEMLRVEHCWPLTDADAIKLGQTQPRQIMLARFAHGLEEPNHDQWHQCGCRVEKFDTGYSTGITW